MMINTRKLSKELIFAKIRHGGVNEDGVVWSEDGKIEIQARPDVAAVIAAHNPNAQMTKHRGQSYDNLSSRERDDLLKSVLIRIGILDENETVM